MWFQNKETHSQQPSISALIKTSINYLLKKGGKAWCSFPCNRQERKTALWGRRVKGHGKRWKSFTQAPLWAGQKRSYFPRHIQETLYGKEKLEKCGCPMTHRIVKMGVVELGNDPRQTQVSHCLHISASMQCTREYATTAAKPRAANCGPCSRRFRDIFCLHQIFTSCSVLNNTIILVD